MRKNLYLAAAALLMIFCLVGCSSSSSFVGTWVNESDGRIRSFYENGTCEGEHWFAESYSIDEEGTLTFTGVSSLGTIIQQTYTKADSMEELEQIGGGGYYLSGNTFAINGTQYKRQ